MVGLREGGGRGVGGQGGVRVHLQDCTGLFQHGGDRRLFVKAAVLLGVAVYGLQENLVDYGPYGLAVLVLRFVGVYMVGLRDGVLLQHAELLQLVCWSAEGRKHTTV